jgi:hypothetical protein
MRKAFLGLVQYMALLHGGVATDQCQTDRYFPFLIRADGRANRQVALLLNLDGQFALNALPVHFDQRYAGLVDVRFGDFCHLRVTRCVLQSLHQILCRGGAPGVLTQVLLYATAEQLRCDRAFQHLQYRATF